MSTWWTVLRVGRWHLAVPFAVLLMLTGVARESSAVEIPMIDWLVPMPVLVALVTVAVGLLPLYATFEILENTLVRTPVTRVVQVVGACGLVVLGCWPAIRVDAVAPLVCVLLATGIAAVVIIGEYAWLIGLTLGFAAILLDGSPERPVTAALNAVPLPLWLVIVGASAVLYWWAGPRESRG